MFYNQSQVDQAAGEVAKLMRGKKTIAVTGAGMSTDAGIPDYRGTGSSGTPTVDYDQFESELYWRKWVWRRNQETWKTVAALEPTRGHKALARLERAGFVSCVSTQNVDGLDHKAGISNVQLLHGTFEQVQCLKCGHRFPRAQIDEILRKLNPQVTADPDPAHVAILAEADRAAAQDCEFTLAGCPDCGGLIKPAVVFFGENLPGEAMDRSFAAAREADVVLVLGTSLAVLTGLWIVREAWGTGSQVVVVNRGRTSADDIAEIRIDAGCSETLQAICQHLNA